MLSLLKSKQFQDEYQNFQTRISNVNNEQLKNNLTLLLAKLVHEIKLLDSHHDQLITTQRLPTMSNEVKANISDIRKTLEKKLKDYEESVV